MSRNEDIDNAIWADPDFEVLSPYATLLYLWSWTNPRCDMAGIYKVSHRTMTESKVPLDEIPAALAELEAARFLFYEDNVLWVRARAKRLRSRSPQMAKSVARDLCKLRPDHPFHAQFIAEYGDDPWLRQALKETVSGTYREGIGNLSKNPVSKPDSHTLSIPSPEGPLTGTLTGTGSSSKTNDELPDDFPRELLPHLRSVFRVLRDLAERHHADAVSPRALANAVTPRKHKPLVAAAYDFAAWADSQAPRRKDVVAGYRHWLDKTNDLAAIEPLDSDGLPAARLAPVQPIRENAASLIRKLNEAEEAASA